MTSLDGVDIDRDRWVIRWRDPGFPDVSAGVIARAVAGTSPAPAGVVPTARPRQVHGGTVVRVDAPGITAAADAVVTSAVDLRLRIGVADCVPVFIAGPRGIGLAHAGWRGTAAGIASETVRELASLTGDRPASMRAYVGPSIGPCCYEVGPEVADRFPAAFRTRGGRHLDLWLANREHLESAGIPAERIDESRRCTRCHQHLLHSHRGSNGGPGRLDAVLIRHGPSGVHRGCVFS